MNLTTHETAREIALLVRAMMDFWKSSNGWPPIEASSLLDRSMLEWQVSLSDCLEKWAGDLTQGGRILAWANIGALVEGQLKLFLAVYYLDYIKDVDAIVDRKTGSIVDPDGLRFEKLRVFFKSRIWVDSEPWDDWILMVQRKRNAIHAFKTRDIGTSQDLHEALKTLLMFVQRINSQLPYPYSTSV